MVSLKCKPSLPQLVNSRGPAAPKAKALTLSLVFKVLKGQFLPQPLQLPPTRTWMWKLKLREMMRLPKSTPTWRLQCGIQTRSTGHPEVLCPSGMCTSLPPGSLSQLAKVFLAIFGFGDQGAGKILTSLGCLLTRRNHNLIHANAPDECVSMRQAPWSFSSP